MVDSHEEGTPLYFRVPALPLCGPEDLLHEATDNERLSFSGEFPNSTRRQPISGVCCFRNVYT